MLCLIEFLLYAKLHFNKCAVYAVAPAVVPPEEHFPSVGYFHKSMPSHRDTPPQKIAGSSIYEYLMFIFFSANDLFHIFIPFVLCSA